MCSTPDGITGLGTLYADGVSTIEERCSTPDGITGLGTHGLTEPPPLPRWGVLNA